MDPCEFRKMGHEMVEFIANYMENIHQMPVFPDVKPGFLLKQLPSSAPEDAEQWENIYKDVNKLILPGVSIKLLRDFCIFFFVLHNSDCLCCLNHWVVPNGCKLAEVISSFCKLPRALFIK